MRAYVEFMGGKGGEPSLSGPRQTDSPRDMSALGFSPKANGAEAPKKLPLLNTLIQLPDRRQHGHSLFPLCYAFVPP